MHYKSCMRWLYMIYRIIHITISVATSSMLNFAGFTTMAEAPDDSAEQIDIAGEH